MPRVALEQEAFAFMWGEKKYGRWNYQHGMEAGRLVAATLRHVLDWYWSCDADPESGASHLGHARANLAMLLEQQRLGTLIDDRPQRKIADVFPMGEINLKKEEEK